MSDNEEKPSNKIPSGRGYFQLDQAFRSLHQRLCTPEYSEKELARRKQRETAWEVFRVLEEGRPQVSSSVADAAEDFDEKLISFSEAVPLLRSAGFDLERARAEAVRLHEQWNLVKALQTKGVVQNADQYGALFDNATFTEKGLQELAENLRKGAKWMPIFNPGHLTPAGLWLVLFTVGNVVYRDYMYGFQHLSELKRINPKDIPNLKNLHKESDEVQIAAFQEAYQKAPKFEPGNPRVLFTPDELLVTIAGRSATEHAQAALKGARFSDLMDNMIRWMTQNYLPGGYNTDSRSWTIDPLSVYPNGNVACLHMHSGRAEPGLGLHDVPPYHASNALGTRSALR